MLAAATVIVIVIAVPVVIVLGLIVVAVAAFRRPGHAVGKLDRQAMKRDEARRRLEAAKATALERARAIGVAGEETQRESSAPELAVDEETRAVEVYARAITTPPDPVEVGIARRQVLNRLAVIGSAVGLGSFGLASIAFLIPAPSKGFGSKIPVDTSIDEIKATIDQKKEPFYVADAKAYLMTYDAKDAKEAAKVYEPLWNSIQASGLMPLYQKCVHLGCKVPWCASSQWFECPCHGSQYNKAGEMRGGPAPRGLDRFMFEVSGKKMTIDTGHIVLGPPIGTDTIGEDAQGPHCV